VSLPSDKFFAGLAKIKFGPGVVGGTSRVVITVGFVFFAAIVVAAWGGAPWWVTLILALLFLLAAGLWCWRAFDYAEKHPDHAVAEGGELVSLREIELQMATRDRGLIDVTPGANTPAPKVITNRSDGDA
jgi:hypothetical protein